MDWLLAISGFILLGLGWHGTGTSGWLMLLVGLVMFWKAAGMMNAKKKRDDSSLAGSTSERRSTARNSSSDQHGARTSRGHTEELPQRGKTTWLSVGDLIEGGSQFKNRLKDDYKKRQQKRIDAVFGKKH